MIDMPKHVIMTDQEKKARERQSRAVRPRVASTLVLLHGPKDNPKILMGQRSQKHDFMPSVYVFPGGRVDRGDSYAKYAGDLSPRTERILESAYTPRRARAVVLAAIRETFEETALMLGQSSPHQGHRIKHPTWQVFQERQTFPDLSGVEVFGRAVTPPTRHKRFDAWFFVKHLQGDLPKTTDSAELLNVDWFTFDEIKNLELQRATVMMLQVLQQYLDYPTAPPHVFYSRMVKGDYRQEKFPDV